MGAALPPAARSLDPLGRDRVCSAGYRDAALLPEMRQSGETGCLRILVAPPLRKTSAATPHATNNWTQRTVQAAERIGKIVFIKRIICKQKDSEVFGHGI